MSVISSNPTRAGHSSKPKSRKNNTHVVLPATTTTNTNVSPPLVSKTRICIKNIPLKLSNEKDLRQFILQRLSSLTSKGDTITITDCRIRQGSAGKKNKTKKGSTSTSSSSNVVGGGNSIAFVGFASSDHAQWAVQQLHRTYYQTTKLHVEMALLPSSSSSFSPTTTTSTTTDIKTNIASNTQSNTTHPTMEKKNINTITSKIVSTTGNSTVPPPIDRKKQAFLAAMGMTTTTTTTESGLLLNDGTNDHHHHHTMSSLLQLNHPNRQFWSNDDTDMIATTITATTSTTTTTMKHNLPRTDDPDSNNNDDDDDSENSNNNDDDDDESDDIDDADPLNRAEQKPLPSSSFIAKNTAMDFLRSKQVNVSDLPLEEEEEEEDDDDDPQPDTTTIQHPNAESNSLSITRLTKDNHNQQQESVHVVKIDQEINAVPVNAKVDDDDNIEENEALLDEVASDGIDPNRLFLRNLPFMITEDELRQHFQQYGTIVECHIAVDDQYRNKGYAFISYTNAASAYTARMSCDQHDFHGRLLHILPAQTNSRTNTAGTTNHHHNHGVDHTSTTTYKESREDQRRANAMNDSTGWMSTHVRDDAVLDNLAVRLGLRKGDLFNVKDTLRSGDAAVRLALGETAIIQENRNYFRQYGIDMETLVSFQQPATNKDRDSRNVTSVNAIAKATPIPRSTVSILVKNLPFDTTYDDLKQIFIGNDVTILLPPSRTIAVVEYKHPNDAKLAFRKLAYRRFKNVPLYLEWAPLAAKTTSTTDASSMNNVSPPLPSDVTKVNDGDDEEPIMHGPTATLYVKNLNFATTEDQLRDFFINKYDANVRTVRIPKKVSTVKRDRVENHNNAMANGKQLSMGFGFVEFSSKESAQKVLKKAQGAVLDDHALELRISSSGGSTDASQKHSISTTNGKDNNKLIVRNVPFQATRKELLQLFGSFGTLKKVRLPKKFDGNHRGFAFVEYLTAKESVHAMNTLSNTHLYGRHLVLEWAEKDDVVDDLEFLRSKAERDVMTSTTAAQPPRNKKIRFD